MADRSDLLNGGQEVVRMSVDAEAELIRQERASVARRKLAWIFVDGAGGIDAVKADASVAMPVAQDFAGLPAYLGLDKAPEQEAGICRGPDCDNELSVSGSFNASTGVSGGASRERAYARRKGFCSRRCMRGASA